MYGYFDLNVLNNSRSFNLPRAAFTGGNLLELQFKLMHFSSCWRKALELLNFFCSQPFIHPTFPASLLVHCPLNIIFAFISRVSWESTVHPSPHTGPNLAFAINAAYVSMMQSSLSSKKYFLRQEGLGSF